MEEHTTLDNYKTKRLRKGPNKKWSDSEEKSLLDFLKNHYTAIEKPTAQAFYKKLQNEYEIFRNIGWLLLRGKVRNLKSTYLKAESWLGNTGQGLLSEGKSIKEYIHSICPYYDELNEIFGGKTNIHIPFLYDSEHTVSEESMLSTDDSMEKFNQYVEILPDECYGDASFSMVYDEVNFQRENESNSNENIKKRENPTKLKDIAPSSKKTVSSVQLLLDAQIRREEFQVQKLNFEREKFDVQMELERRKIELEENMRMKELEQRKLEMEERIRIKEIEERIRMKELENEIIIEKIKLGIRE